MIPQFIISAPTSGAGKTTVSRGLMALLTGKGLMVQPFKCGPDYIDTKFHTTVCGRPSINIDTFFCDEERARQLYWRYMTRADVAIVEGMMGMYDGYDRDRGSTAEIARALGLPLVLVVDARSTAYSIAPLLSGFIHFRNNVEVVGVIFNRVGSKKHESMLRQVCAELDTECFGCLPRMKECETKSRYLGLDFSQKNDAAELAHLIDKYIDWRKILSQTQRETLNRTQESTISQGRKHTLVARNAESFSFIYQEHIDSLRSQGQVDFFNPEEDKPIPQDIDFLYLPGGYPEKHVEALVAARQTRHSIAEYASHGGKILAECGGMMYLCNSIVTDDGEYEMCGVLPYTITARSSDKRLSLGYRQFMLNGKLMKGHEFHYSQFLGDSPASAVQVYNACGEAVSTPVFKQDGVLASYTHLYLNE